MADHYYWDEVRKNIADMRIWLSKVEAKLDRIQPAVERVVVDSNSIDRAVAHAESATAIQHALGQEFGIDRRTVLQRAERVVKAYDLMAKLGGDWSTDVEFWRALARRQPDGRVRLAHALATLGK